MQVGPAKVKAGKLLYPLKTPPLIKRKNTWLTVVNTLFEMAADCLGMMESYYI